MCIFLNVIAMQENKTVYRALFIDRKDQECSNTRATTLIGLMCSRSCDWAKADHDDLIFWADWRQVDIIISSRCIYKPIVFEVAAPSCVK